MKTDQPQRLAPVALLIIWIRGFISWWPLFVGGGLSILRADMSFNQFLLWGGLIVGVLVLTLIWSILHYLRFTYLVAPNGLTINSGVLIRKVNHIPYDRIQTVQRQQWFFLKPLGLEQVAIETAGKESKKAEGMLSAVPVAVADAINRYRQGNVQPVTPDALIIRLSLLHPIKQAPPPHQPRLWQMRPIKSTAMILINTRSLH